MPSLGLERLKEEGQGGCECQGGLVDRLGAFGGPVVQGLSGLQEMSRDV